MTAASHPSSARRRAVAVILQQLTLTAIQQLQGTIALSSSSPILQILTASSALWYPQSHPTKSIPYDFASWIQRILPRQRKASRQEVAVTQPTFVDPPYVKCALSGYLGIIGKSHHSERRPSDIIQSLYVGRRHDFPRKKGLRQERKEAAAASTISLAQIARGPQR